MITTSVVGVNDVRRRFLRFSSYVEERVSAGSAVERSTVLSDDWPEPLAAIV
jgi:hypothetical protein